MTFVTGQELGTKICKALDLDPLRVRSIRLELEAGSIAEVEVGYFVQRKQGDDVEQVMKRYALVPHPADLPAVVRPELEEAS